MARTTPDVVAAGTLSARDQPTIAVGAERQLRPWADDDRDHVLQAFADPDIERWHLRRLPDTADAEAWIDARHDDWQQERGASWAVTNPDRGVVGQVALRGVNLAMGVSQVSYWVMPEARGRGVATTALRALTAWGLREVGFHRLWLMHSTRNGPSCTVAANAGYEAEGTLREALLHTDGWHDMHVHGRVAHGRRQVASRRSSFLPSPTRP